MGNTSVREPRLAAASPEGSVDLVAELPHDPGEWVSAGEGSGVHWHGKLLTTLVVAMCFVIALTSRDKPGSQDAFGWIEWISQLAHPGIGPARIETASPTIFEMRWILGFLIVMPFAISWVVASNLRILRPQGRDPVLSAFNPSMTSTPDAHVSQDRKLWANRCHAIKKAWEYEWSRIQRLQCRLGLQALIFGAMATLALTGAVLLRQSLPGGEPAKWIACSAATAVATAFFANLVRVMLRISGGDVTTRTFAWATRSLTLVIIADVGLCLILGEEGVSGATRAPLLGIFVGATGDHALQFLIERAAKMFNTGTAAAPQSSPLLEIEGITAAHVERLEEEGILSIHDLAFAPTPRLFFATAYSLQQICDWQDRALLAVYVGKQAADALAAKLDIRGAMDLRAFAHAILFETADADTDQIRESLRKALDFDEGGFAALLRSMAHDEVTMRLRYYWGSVVGWSLPGEVAHARGEAAALGNGAALATDPAHDAAATHRQPSDQAAVEAHGGNGVPHT